MEAWLWGKPTMLVTERIVTSRYRDGRLGRQPMHSCQIPTTPAPNIADAVGLAAGLDYVTRLGWERIADWGRANGPFTLKLGLLPNPGFLLSHVCRLRRVVEGYFSDICTDWLLDGSRSGSLSLETQVRPQERNR